MEDAGTPKPPGTNGHSAEPLTLDALGAMISETRTALAGQLQSVRDDQVLAGTVLEELARSHRRTRKKIIKFIDRMADVYQRQQAISTRLTEIESWQKLHDKDHRDSKPPPSKGKRRGRLAVGAGHR
jgi:hypothetical protein